jgi:hypothetical protein
LEKFSKQNRRDNPQVTCAVKGSEEDFKEELSSPSRRRNTRSANFKIRESHLFSGQSIDNLLVEMSEELNKQQILNVPLLFLFFNLLMSGLLDS